MKKMCIVLAAAILIELLSISLISKTKTGVVLSQHTKKVALLKSLATKPKSEVLSAVPTPISAPASQPSQIASNSIPAVTPTPTSASSQTVSQDLDTAKTTPSPTPNNGNGFIQGSVTIGPSCGGPVHIDSDNCGDLPYDTQIIIKDEKGENIISTTSSTNGEFHAELPPGNYMILIGSDEHTINRFPSSASQIVSVYAGKTTNVSFSLDSGLR